MREVMRNKHGYKTVNSSETDRNWEEFAAAILKQAWLDWWRGHHYFYCKVCHKSYHTVRSVSKKHTCVRCQSQTAIKGCYMTDSPELSTIVLEQSGYTYRNELGAFFRGGLFNLLCLLGEADPGYIAKQMKQIEPTPVKKNDKNAL